MHRQSIDMKYSNVKDNKKCKYIHTTLYLIVMQSKYLLTL